MTNTNHETQTPGATRPNLTPGAKHAAPSGAQLGQNASHTVGAEASKTATYLTDEARALASQATTSAQSLVKTEVERRTSQGADELSEIARVLHQSGRELEGNMAGPYVRKAAQQIDHLSHYVRTAQPGDVVQSVSRFAKRDPVLFLGGAFALGLLGSRLMGIRRPSWLIR